MDIRRFLAELKGRGVNRVAAFYAAGSWALLQIADVFFPILGLPDWAITGVLVAAALGFPLAIALAWVFEITPAGLVETDSRRLEFGHLSLSPVRVVELVLLIALVCLVGFLYIDRLTENNNDAESPFTSLPEDQRPSVAVMAFENISDDPSAEYFGDGLAEEILNLLTRLNELHVAARTSSFYYKGKDVDLREVGRKLGVGHVLEGSVRRAGDQVRVTAQLIEMKTGFHLWSETYDMDYGDSFRIQDEIARQVVAELQVLLSDNSLDILNDRPILDPQAYDYYLQGREYLRKSLSAESMERAVALFEEAVAQDKDYADAHAGLCDAKLGLYQLDLDPEHFEVARSACETALSIEPEALPVYVALGNLYRLSGRTEEALGQFEQALAIDPRSVDALDGLGQVYRFDNKATLAEKTFLRAIQVQPYDWRGYLSMGGVLFSSGRYEDAIPYYRRITELMPDNANAFNGLGACHSMLGDFDRAVEAFQRSLDLGPTTLAYANLGTNLFYTGHFEKAAEMYSKATESAPEDFRWWGQLGDAYRHADGLAEMAGPMYRKAIQLANKVIEVNPEDAKTLGLLAHYHAGLGDRDNALQYIGKASALAPKDVYVYYDAATALCSLGDEDQAALALKKAVELGYSRKLIVVDANLCSVASRPEFQPVADVGRG
jgi:TolB-like protein/Tfp pilus assembly protein PilF